MAARAKRAGVSGFDFLALFPYRPAVEAARNSEDAATTTLRIEMEHDGAVLVRRKRTSPGAFRLELMGHSRRSRA